MYTGNARLVSGIGTVVILVWHHLIAVYSRWPSLYSASKAIANISHEFFEGSQLLQHLCDQTSIYEKYSIVGLLISSQDKLFVDPKPAKVPLRVQYGKNSMRA